MKILTPPSINLYVDKSQVLQNALYLLFSRESFLSSYRPVALFPPGVVLVRVYHLV